MVMTMVGVGRVRVIVFNGVVQVPVNVWLAGSRTRIVIVPVVLVAMGVAVLVCQWFMAVRMRVALPQ